MNTISPTKGERTKQAILQKAIRLINIKGYHDASLNDIIEETGVKKGNFYFYFASKDDFICELIQEARLQYGLYMRKSVQGKTPLQRLQSLFDAIRRFHGINGFVGGCIFGNMALELGDRNQRITELVRQTFDEWASMIESIISEAMSEGDVRCGNASSAARSIIAALEGAVMMAKLSKREEDFKDICDTLMELLVKDNDSVHKKATV